MKQAPNATSFLKTENHYESNDIRSYNADELAGLRQEQQYLTKQKYQNTNSRNYVKKIKRFF